MNINLEILKSQIENLDKSHHIEILKILKKKSQIKLNENRNGVFINLTYLPNDVLMEVVEYMNYVNDQEILLNPIEKQKETYKNSFFDKTKEKGIKDETLVYCSK
jgi:hypothetical protein